MAQNVYDNQDFFKEYIQLPRQVEGLDGTPEWQDLQALIPNPKGTNFLDLGCGFGWVGRWAREEGAESVLGVDVSEKMLSKAVGFPTDSCVTYVQADLESFELPINKFDIVFSSLTFHYLKGLPVLISGIYRSLTPGGALVFSVEHPIFTAPRNAKFIEDAEGQSIWPLDSYLSEGSRTTNWLAEGVIKQHRTIATYVTILLEAGFTLSAIIEWGPSLEQVKESPQWADERKRPPFLLMKAIKGNSS
ncbi:hypothetical protein IFR04_010937 [Cadophora malorum]|uniref:Methyltransferase type 11 domain-containing protein n=1 Tax=Cadophora malorum TaxID=108018 RepID=A0A8H7W9D1_9HELO|nr:hypothetical protein IFR04_010937 [Cadophora malorum]